MSRRVRVTDRLTRAALCASTRCAAALPAFAPSLDLDGDVASTTPAQLVVAGIGHSAVMRIRYWGTRGSIATPGPSTVRYGGNTSCVELRSARGTLVVFDCGTGARLLGRALVEQSRAAGDPVAGSILLGHTHWDHIQGLPFFEPLFGGGHWDVYGPRGLGVSLDQTLAGQMNYQYFPVALDQIGTAVEYHELVEGTFQIGDLIWVRLCWREWVCTRFPWSDS